MNNFVILVKTKKELKERTIQFLKVAERYNLCFKQSKCDFDTEEISILGVVVVQMEDEKFKIVKE